MAFKALGGRRPSFSSGSAYWRPLPVLAWIALEFEAAGHRLTGVIFLAAAICSAFVLDILSLGYSAAAAFHLVGLLVLIALATYAVLGQPTARGLLGAHGGLGSSHRDLRALPGTVPFLLPAFALALLVGVRRAALRRVHRTAIRPAPPHPGCGRGRWLSSWSPTLAFAPGATPLVATTRDAYGRDQRPCIRTIPAAAVLEGPRRLLTARRATSSVTRRAKMPSHLARPEPARAPGGRGPPARHDPRRRPRRSPVAGRDLAEARRGHGEPLQAGGPGRRATDLLLPGHELERRA